MAGGTKAAKSGDATAAKTGRGKKRINKIAQDKLNNNEESYAKRKRGEYMYFRSNIFKGHT